MRARSASTASPMRMDNPHDAIAHGIGMVHQHFMLVDTFTVLENLVLGAEGGPLLAGGLAAARAELERLAREYGLTVNPDAKIADLSVGEQQRVEILKVLFRGARILILDEPSAVLTPQETDQLFRILATLEGARRHHRADHPQAARDHGRDRPCLRHAPGPDRRRPPHRRDQSRGAGRADGRPQGAAAARQGGSRSRARCCCRPRSSSLVDHRGVRLLDDVDLELRAGEIVGIAGVSGNGQTELLQILSGIRRPTGGTLTVRGRVIDAHHPSDPAEMRDAGPGARARGSPAPGHGGGLPGLGDVDPGLPGRTAVLPQLPARRAGGRPALRHADGPLRRAAARAGAALVELLRRQPAEAGAGARDGARAQGAAGRPADARRRYRRHRVHPSRAGEEPRRGLRRAGGLGRARRDPVARRPHPGDVRRPHRRRGAGRPRRRTHARPDDGRGASAA